MRMVPRCHEEIAVAIEQPAVQRGAGDDDPLCRASSDNWSEKSLKELLLRRNLYFKLSEIEMIILSI